MFIAQDIAQDVAIQMGLLQGARGSSRTNMFTILPHFGPCTCGCKRHPHLVLGLLCDAVVVMKNLVQTGLQQLMQGGPRQGMPPDSVHLQAQLEQQRLDEPGGLEKTRAQKDLHRIVN